MCQSDAFLASHRCVQEREPRGNAMAVSKRSPPWVCIFIRQCHFVSNASRKSHCGEHWLHAWVKGWGSGPPSPRRGLMGVAVTAVTPHAQDLR